jgi:hypothetical protein
VEIHTNGCGRHFFRITVPHENKSPLEISFTLKL